MAGICSAHMGYEKDCPRCNAFPWDVLNTTKEEWDSKCAKSKAQRDSINAPVVGLNITK